MAIDINNLSAKELFELAQQKEKEEAEEAARLKELEQLKSKRASLVQEHQSNLTDIESQIKTLNAKREALNKQHTETLAQLDTEINELLKPKTQPAKPAPASIAEPSPPPARAAEPATTEPPKTAPKARSSSQSNDELASHILEIMKKRSTISDSLLKEQLKSQGLSIAALPRVLDQLIKEKKVLKKGSNNYALSKKY